MFNLANLGTRLREAIEPLVESFRDDFPKEAALQIASALCAKQMDEVWICPHIVSKDPRHAIPRIILFSGIGVNGERWNLMYTDGKSNNDKRAPDSLQELFRMLTHHESGAAMLAANILRKKHEKLGLLLDLKLVNEGMLKFTASPKGESG